MTCNCRGGPTCCRLLSRLPVVMFDHPPLHWSGAGNPWVDPADIFRSRAGQEELSKAWHLANRSDDEPLNEYQGA